MFLSGPTSELLQLQLDFQILVQRLVKLLDNQIRSSLTSPEITIVSPAQYDSLSVVTAIGSTICPKAGTPLMLAIKIANIAKTMR